ncbi:MAG TPA: hypothetical protein VGA08_02040 [Candidatus Saccharimonadales bacterium]
MERSNRRERGHLPLERVNADLIIASINRLNIKSQAEHPLPRPGNDEDLYYRSRKIIEQQVYTIHNRYRGNDFHPTARWAAILSEHEDKNSGEVLLPDKHLTPAEQAFLRGARTAYYQYHEYLGFKPKWIDLRHGLPAKALPSETLILRAGELRKSYLASYAGVSLTWDRVIDQFPGIFDHLLVYTDSARRGIGYIVSQLGGQNLDAYFETSEFAQVLAALDDDSIANWLGKPAD